ncbi:MAG TPA: MmcQ/YjbR family DNA-binding protein [Streptosporangiaceae bacterium]
MVTLEEVRAVAVTLPRTSEHLIREYVKFRVGKIVYVSVAPDETMMGFGYPKEERDALIAAEPEKFALPRLSDQRFHWIHARMAALGPDELRELVIDAWRMCVPQQVAAARLNG